LHPEIQHRLRAEIIRVLNKHNGELTYDGIQEMAYLDMVVTGEKLDRVEFSPVGYPPEQYLVNTALCFACRPRSKYHMPIPVAARSKAWVCGGSLVGIAGSNPIGDMDVCLL
jgi:hypothetical protein